MTINLQKLQEDLHTYALISDEHMKIIKKQQHELNGAYKILDMHQKQLQILVARIKQLEEQK